MKIILIILSASIFVLQACDKEAAGFEPGIEIDNIIAPYAELVSTATRNVNGDTTINFTFQIREAQQEAVTITYSITGAINKANQTAVIDRNKLTVVVPLNIPAGTLVPPATTGTATLTLIKAVTASGRALTIGQKNTPATQKATINISL